MKRFGEGIRAGVRRLFVPASIPARARRDLEDELRAHVEARIEYLVARGQSPDGARAEALARFGDFDTAIAELHASAKARDRRLSVHERIAGVLQDARYVARGLARSPAFTAGVIATLVLGLGINSAVFRVADRTLLRAPAGIVDPRGLRRATTITPLLGAAPMELATLSYPDARRVIDSRAFVRAAAYATGRQARLTDGRVVAAAYVDSGFFSLLGMKAAGGRLFAPDEAEVGADIPVVVVSYEFWKRELGEAPLTGEKSLVLNDRSYRVIGATARGFAGPDLDPVDVWLPLGVAVLGRANVNGTEIPWYRTSNFRAMNVLGRVSPGTTDARVASRAGSALTAADREQGSFARTLSLRPLVWAHEAMGPSPAIGIIGRLSGVAAVVLLIACANAANLLLARSLRRRREIAVRIALGGARARIVRLLIVESTILGLAGGAGAALAGYWTGESLRRLLFPAATWATSVVDDRTLAFTLAIALVAGLVAGLAPAIQLTNPDLVTALKDGRNQPGKRSHITRGALVVLQTAFALMLLIASGLLVRSLQKLNSVALGFEPDGLVTALVPTGTFRGQITDPGAPAIPNRAAASDLAARLRTVPAVRDVALASTVPFGAHSSMSITIPGRPDPAIPPQNGPYVIAVSPTYFSVMGTRLIKGRVFSNADDRGSRAVAVVGSTMAKLYWQDGNPFGTCILISGEQCAQVVGIVEDVRDTRGGGEAPIRFYLPLSQHPDSAGALVVRTSATEAGKVATMLRSAIPPAQRPQIEVISERVATALRPWRLATMLFGALGLVALILSCVGVYSVMSYVASERIHELGVRIVLGATAGDVVRLVLAGGMRLVAVGTVAGLIGAAVSAHLLASLLFGVSPRDPVVYAGSVAILAAIGIVATLVPAMSVMRTDPTVALRSE